MRLNKNGRWRGGIGERHGDCYSRTVLFRFMDVYTVHRGAEWTQVYALAHRVNV